MGDDGDMSQPVCSFRKIGAKKKGQVRQRKKSDSSDGDSDEKETMKEVLRKKRRQNPMVQTTKRGGISKDCASSSSDDSQDLNNIVAEHAFAASGSAAPLGPKDSGATAVLEIDTEIGKDAQSQFERVQKQLEEGLEKDGKTLYKGQAMYGAKKAKDTAKGNASSGMNRVGPVRAPQFLRQTVRWDFAPDICKDYKETGYCTFGDSCKFLHDRSDYKHGWEIERDYQAGKNNTDDTNYEIPSDGDDLPEECQICDSEFVSPVVTKCKHYFCEKCALNAFKKSKRCQVCNENTGGVFNIAKDIIAKMSGEGPSKKRKEIESESEKEEEEEKEIADTDMQMLPENDEEKSSNAFSENEETHDVVEQDGCSDADDMDGETIENEA